MLSILKREYIRPYQVVNAMSNALKDSEYRRSFLRDPCLVLIIKRPIETVEIEIEKHGEPYLCLLFYCSRTPAVSRTNSRSEGRAKAVGVGSTALLGGAATAPYGQTKS
jgi:hypothetical protein